MVKNILPSLSVENYQKFKSMACPQLSSRPELKREFVQKYRIASLIPRNKKRAILLVLCNDPVGIMQRKDRAFKYRDQFQYLFNLDICLMDGKLELLLLYPV